MSASDDLPIVVSERPQSASGMSTVEWIFRTCVLLCAFAALTKATYLYCNEDLSLRWYTGEDLEYALMTTMHSATEHFVNDPYPEDEGAFVADFREIEVVLKDRLTRYEMALALRQVHGYYGLGTTT
jgi:hypothetical protein